MTARLLALALLLAVVLGAAPAQAITVERVVSPAGIEAWLVEDHSLPLVTLELSFAGGAASDPAGKAGLATMTTALLDEGAGSLDSQAFQGRLEDLASGVSFSASQDHVAAALRTTTSSRDGAFELLRLALAEPRFDPDAVNRVRGDLIASVQRRAENPNAIASRVWWHNAFADHPYALSTEGTVATLGAISAEDLHRFVHERFARDVLKLAVVGDITPAELASLLDRTFAGLPEHAAPRGVGEAAVHEPGALLLVRKGIPQSVVTFGEAGIKRDDPDWYAAYLVNYILGGGGFSSRLMTEVREKRGLAYGVATYLVPLREGAVILGSVATQNGRVADSIAVIRQEWQRMHDEGPTEQELAGAKTYLTGSFPTQFDSTSRIARTLVQVQQDQLGIDFIDKRNGYLMAVTLEDARRVARRLLDPAALSFAIVGEPTNLAGAREVAPDGS